MDIHQLTYFITVANCGSVTKGAELLHVSQSAVSMAIARLEKELGIQLWERQGRRIALTRAGDHFAAAVAPALALLENARLEAMELGADAQTDLRLSVDALGFVSALERRFLGRYPHIRFRQTFDTAEEMQTRLLGGSVDFCLTNTALTAPDILLEPLFQERMVLLVGPEHPFAKRQRMSLAEAAGEKFAALAPEYGMRRLTDRICFQSGFRPQIVFEGCEMQMLTDIVSTGMAVALAGEMILHHAPSLTAGGFQAIPLEESHCSIPIYLAQRKGHYLTADARLFYNTALRFGRLAAAYGRYPSEEELFAAGDSVQP